MNRGTARYPLLEIDLDKLKANLAALIERCQSLSVEVAGVVKGFSALPEAAGVYTECGVRSLASSRLSQLRALRARSHPHPHALRASGGRGGRGHESPERA